MKGAIVMINIVNVKAKAKQFPQLQDMFFVWFISHAQFNKGSCLLESN